MLFFVCLLFTSARGLFYDDYEPLGFEYFDEIENATIIDLSVNATTPYTEDRGEYRIFPSKVLKFIKSWLFETWKVFFGLDDEELNDDITLEDLLSSEGFDLRYTNEQRFQKLRQFRRLVSLKFRTFS